MATALGTRILERYVAGEATLAVLTRALEVGWISQEEYDAALLDREEATSPAP